MARVFPPASSSESFPAHETLFPFVATTVIDGLANLETSSDNMLRLLTEARGIHGAADQLYANLPFDELVDWHISNHDFEQEGALLYKAGLLYGMDLAQYVARTADMRPDMKFDDAKAFGEAILYLESSYRGLDDEADNNWMRQKDRELLYTGSDILSLANATLNDRISNRLYAQGAPIRPNVLAQHVGVVDGAIFVNAYRAFARGFEPNRFEEPVHQFIPTFDPKIHERENVTDLASIYEFENLSELLQMTQGITELSGEERLARSLAGAQYRGKRRMVQIGPNAFTTAVELETVEAPQYSRKRLAGFLGMGALVDIAYITFDSDLPAKYVPMATIFNSILWLATENAGRKSIRRDAAERNIGFAVRTAN